MSLIVVRIENNNLVICCDTKLTYPSTEPTRSRAMPRDGILKCVVFSDRICVAFANVVERAEKAISGLSSDASVVEVVEHLLWHHNDSAQQTDFIIAVGGAPPLIYEIKEGTVSTRKSAWIGSKRGFSYFQEAFFAKETIPHLPGSNMEMMEALSDVPLMARMSDAFDKVIENEKIPEVDGFKFVLVWLEDHFYAPFYLKMSRGDIIVTGIGGQVIGHETAEKGGYSVHFVGCTPDFQKVALHIRQGRFGIVYQRQVGGLLWPTVYEDMDEFVFLPFIAEQFGILAKVRTQDAGATLYERGMGLFAKRQWDGALSAFEEALLHVRDDLEAKTLLAKGVTFLNLRLLEEAEVVFRNLISKFPSYRSHVAAVYAQGKK